MDDIDDVLKLIVSNGPSTPEFVDARVNYKSNPEVAALAQQSRKFKLIAGGVTFCGVLFTSFSQNFGMLLFLGGLFGIFVIHKVFGKKIENVCWQLYVSGLRAKYEDIKSNMSRAEWETYKLNLNTTLNSGKR